MEQRLIPAKARTNEIMDLLFAKGFNFSNICDMGSLGLPSNIDWAYGATRLVIWDWDNTDFVVKIPLGTDCFKYCEKEVDVYRASVIEGVDKYFAWVEFIDYYHEWPVYAMEFVDCDQESIEDSAFERAYVNWCGETGSDSEDHDARDEFSEMYWDDFDMPTDSIYDWLFEQMDHITAKTLRVFISRNRINDIHSGNLGYKNNHIVIVDYASFGW